MMESLSYLGFVLTMASLLLNIFLLKILFQRSDSEAKNFQTRYFENVDEYAGPLKNCKKYSVYGQVFHNGIPVGGQFKVQEHLIEDFSWEKFSKLRTEIISPLLQTGIEVGIATLAPNGLAQKNLLNKLANLTKKAG
ncbi:MAG: hypothetical protein ACK5RO_12500 [Pseudobdellovibrionaceae bacterium]|jgi:hypothetical protein